ncbi:hypothetical protein ACOYR1_02795 [Thalassotalea piscium]
MDDFEKKLRSSLNDVEHAMSLYADSYCTLPAKFIYDKERLKEFESVIKTCHIYMIGYLPRRELVDISQKKNHLAMKYKVANKTRKFLLPLPQHVNLVFDEEWGYFCENEKGEKLAIPDEAINNYLAEYSTFDVRYIGQAYGTDGSRNALDRLLKHETLQKISLTAIPEGSELSLLLLEVKSSNKLITAFNPFASTKDNDGARVKAGINKLYNTTEQERISLFEAAFIRYFSPQFNKDFKNSFPSTNLKLLKDCYEKDFSALFAEIYIEGLPFQLCSESVEPKHHHIAKYDLHKDIDRKAFFIEK